MNSVGQFLKRQFTRKNTQKHCNDNERGTTQKLRDTFKRYGSREVAEKYLTDTKALCNNNEQIFDRIDSFDDFLKDQYDLKDFDRYLRKDTEKTEGKSCYFPLKPADLTATKIQNYEKYLNCAYTLEQLLALKDKIVLILNTTQQTEINCDDETLNELNPIQKLYCQIKKKIQVLRENNPKTKIIGNMRRVLNVDYVDVVNRNLSEGGHYIMIRVDDESSEMFESIGQGNIFFVTFVKQDDDKYIFNMGIKRYEFKVL